MLQEIGEPADLRIVFAYLRQTTIHKGVRHNNKVHVSVGKVKTSREGTKASDVTVFIAFANDIPKTLKQLVSDDVFKFARSYKVIEVAYLLM